MNSPNIRFGFLLLALFVKYCAQVQGERISETKCEEYRAKTLNKQSTITLSANPTIIKHLSYSCSKTVELIVGGEAAGRREFPHHAILGWPRKDNTNEYEFHCGGSLISEWFVLTAAHCFKKTYPEIVRLGEHNLLDKDTYYADFEISEFVLHPNYVFGRVYYDIALIKLENKVNFSNHIRPACLWTGTTFNFTKVVATGFGLDDDSGNRNDVLHKVGLDLLETEKCEAQYGSQRTFRKGIVDSQICIGSHEGNKDTCVGDSGGPVQVVTDPKGCLYHIVGVTSTGSSCGKAPGIYTRVSSFIDWIESKVWN
ncbi:serine protease snake-like [Uranotaenia lowii]|uniref:serine protease snake-like n=1 Tax=Uranotaenia lowii TaxID=190385 RepID=UPI00247996B1|nr:serine protease snake-like [Uranotaenia lowii]